MFDTNENSLNLSERIRDAQASMHQYMMELNDYQMINACVQAIKSVHVEPDRYDYSNEEYHEVLAAFETLCQKHEIRLPDQIDWHAFEVI